MSSLYLRLRPVILGLFPSSKPRSKTKGGLDPEESNSLPTGLVWLLRLLIGTALLITFVIIERSLVSAPGVVPAVENNPPAPAQQQQPMFAPPPQSGQWTMSSNPYLRTPYATPDESRIASIKAGLKHVWDGHVATSYGADETRPTAGTGNNRWGTICMTILDSLDTLWIAGMKEEFDKASEWVETHLDFHSSSHGGVSTFETTIRALGGLVSAYELSGRKGLLRLAVELGDGLLPAFNTKTGIAQPHVTFFRGGGGGGQTTIAEAGTLQVEFGGLAKNSLDERFWKAEKWFDLAEDAVNQRDGMLPMGLNVGSGSFGGLVSWGASGDSAYEYFLKYYLYNPRGGATDERLKHMYRKSVETMKGRLVKKSANGLTYLTDSGSSRGSGGKMEHLACFVPGLLALGAMTLDDGHGAEDLKLAEELAAACYAMYERTDTGLAAEAVWFNDKGLEDFRPVHSMKWNILRPETLESLFVLYQVTGDVKYREWSWKIWQHHDGVPCLQELVPALIVACLPHALYATFSQAQFLAL
ncbi:hypothetical protein TrRE_jg6052 [Triparma retinervis]|uniref:alpha-1,2-Mannosidase n=1 Tax=Triparma retinervis TaxID=2557542 RepID=A0A9W7F9K7_9STRA|nr:hypothetical protein TrRE_jg6052 [Triparma retinervis]